MKLRWYGQSAFLLTAEKKVFLDPFPAAMPGLAERGLRFDYAPIEGVEAELLLVTHEHADHNAVEAVGGSPHTIRSTAGTFAETPVGEVVAVASEHDEVAGTRRGPNALFRFALDGLVVCHLGDFGQPALRPEQRAALGEVDVLFVPVGGGPTTGGSAAADLVRDLAPRLVVPMHYHTEAISFLDPPDAFLDALGAEVRRLDGQELDVAEHLGSRDAPVVGLFAAPLR